MIGSKRIKTEVIDRWDGIDRTASSNDSDKKFARALSDFDITETGRITRRPEFAALYENRPSQFEHTTNDDSLGGGVTRRLVFAPTNGDTIYRSHGRKGIVIGKPVSVSVEYVFTCYIQVIDSADTQYLKVVRGYRTGDTGYDGLDIAWRAGIYNTPTTVPAQPLTVMSVADTVSDVDETTGAAWIECSMVMNAAKDTIYLGVSSSVDGAAPVVALYSITNLYTANFSTGATVAVVQANLETDAAITRDIDIEIGSDDSLMMVWGKTVGADDVVRYANSSDWATVATFTTAGIDFYGFSLVRDPRTVATMYLAYIGNAAPSGLRYHQFTAGVIAGGSGVTIATVYTDGGIAKPFSHAVFTIDNNGDKHFLYRTAAATLKHSIETVGGVLTQTAITTDLETTYARMVWDMVIKDSLVSVFYVTETAGTQISKAVVIVDSTDEDYDAMAVHTVEIVEAGASTSVYRYFVCYRRYEANTSKRLSYIATTTTAVGTPLVKYLHSDKGFFDANFDGDIADAGDSQNQIKALCEPVMHDANGASSQILVIQCSDNRLYKRGDYQWTLLEGSRLVDNSDWNWETVFTPRAYFVPFNGELRAAAGTGATNQNVWYGYIPNRYWFRNDGTGGDGKTSIYNDHYSDLQRLPAPSAGIATVTALTVDQYKAIFTNWAAQADYSVFQFIEGGVLTGQSPSKVFSPFRVGAEAGTFAPFIEVFQAISYEYDGYQESQLAVQSSDTAIVLGAANNFTLVKIAFVLPTWNTASSPISRRITAVNIYWGTRQAAEDTKYTVQYKMVKRIQVSRAKMTGEDPFEGDSDGTDAQERAAAAIAGDIKGRKQWKANANGTFTLITYVDYDHYVSREINGSAVDRLGTGLVLYRSTGSGTEIYTKETTIPEGYAVAQYINNELWVGGVRLAGVTRTDRLMRSARAFGAICTPDQLSDESTTIENLGNDIYGMGLISESVLGVVGTRGVDSFDVRGGSLTRLKSAANVGTDARGSVAPILEGGLGDIFNGLVYKDANGNVRVFDGAGAPIISDAVFQDHDASNAGVGSLSATTAQFLYLSHYRKLFLAYVSGSACQVFVLDLRQGRRWLDWRFTKQIDAMTAGVDGECWFTDGDEVWQWPKAGSDDTPDPKFRPVDYLLPPDARGVLKEAWADYICVGTTLQMFASKDRSASDTNSTSTCAASTAQVRDRTGWLRGSAQFKREIAVGVKVTTASALTSLTIDQIVFSYLIQGKRP